MFEEYYYFKEEIQEIQKNIQNRSSSLSRPTSSFTSNFRAIDDRPFNSGRLSRSNSRCDCSSDFVSTSVTYEQPRVPSYSQCYLRAPTPPPIVETFRHRAPTPEPDVIERITVKPQPQRIIEKIIEKPRVPPPVIINKEVCEAAPPPIYKTKVVDVDYTPRENRTVNVSTSQESIPSCTCNRVDCQYSSYSSKRYGVKM